MNNIQQFAKELTELSKKHGLILGADIFNRVCVSAIPPEQQYFGFRYFVDENMDGLEWLAENEPKKPERAPQSLEPSSLRDEQDGKLRAEEARIKEALRLVAEKPDSLDSIPEWMRPIPDWSVEARNALQQSGRVHPYTCGDDACRETLRAVEGGWVCDKCGYEQSLTIKP